MPISAFAESRIGSAAVPSARRRGLRNRRRPELSLPSAAAQVDRVRSLHYCRLRGFIIRTARGISRVSWSRPPGQGCHNRAGRKSEPRGRRNRSLSLSLGPRVTRRPSVCLRGSSVVRLMSVRPSLSFSFPKVSSRAAIMRTLKFAYSSFKCPARSPPPFSIMPCEHTPFVLLPRIGSV